VTTDPATLRVVEPRPDAVEAQRAGRAAHEKLAGSLGYTPVPAATDPGDRQ
jgi:hypothetical protein